MADKTSIEWCDSTFNPWTGCTKVGPGCDHCYAEGWAKRSGTVQWGPHAERRRTSVSNWRAPLHWEREHETFQAQHGRRRRVFCASLADVFDNQVPAEWRRDLFELIGRTQHLDWLLLTKRIGNAREMLNAVVEDMSCGINTWDERPWPGVWIGATVVNQEEADRDIQKLLAVPAEVRFLSVEPMLGPMNLRPWLLAEHGRRQVGAKPGIGWVIGGFESGHRARPGNPAWARALRDQCAAAGTAFLWKQNGEWAPGSLFPDGIPSGTSCDFDGDLKTDDERVWKVGKKAAGRLLDGVTHDQFPKAT